jgi:hypothetical protein
MIASSRFPTHAIGLLLAALLTQSLPAGLLSDYLTPSQESQVRNGSQVLVVEDLEGCPWPRVTIYQKINASSEEVAAVFFDFEDNKSFIPNVLRSKISRIISPAEFEVDFSINIPILPDEHYTALNTLSQTAPECYGIAWKLLKARQTKDSVGSFQTEPFEGGALMRYRNLVTPGSRMAGLLRGIAIRQMQNAAEAIASRAESLKTSNPDQLERQVQDLRAALAE